MSGPSNCVCPSCRVPMEARSFPRKLYGNLEIDLCFACQGIWFDNFGSMQLAPGGVVDMFKLIHERSGERRPLADKLSCPRCSASLVRTVDRVNASVFNYYRCTNEHGHFITFAQFMTEKGFVRQLSAAEINKLKEYVGIVRCTGCGAPVDIRKDIACSYCHAPIAILDPKAVETALAGYQRAAAGPGRGAAPQAGAVLPGARGAGGAVPEIGDPLLDGVGMASHLAGH